MLWVPDNRDTEEVLNLLRTLDKGTFQQKAQDLINARFPSFNYRKLYVDDDWNEIDTTCAICLEPADFQLQCSHVFHRRCLAKWKGTCPLCRREIKRF